MKVGRKGVFLALGVGLAPVGCLQPRAFVCSTDVDCDRSGLCEVGGVCSTMAPECPSARRYADSAGDLAGRCVPGDPPPDSMIPEEGGPCDEADDCDDGYCEAEGYCSFSSDECESGRSFGKSDDLSIQGECVTPHTCEDTFKDKFQDGMLDTPTYFVLTTSNGMESWVDEANSRTRFRIPGEIQAGEGVWLTQLADVDLTASSILADVERPPDLGMLMTISVRSNLDTSGPSDVIYAIFDATNATLQVGNQSETVDVDFAQTPFIGVVVETSRATMVLSADGDTLEEVAELPHDIDMSFAYFEFGAQVTGEGAGAEVLRGDLGSVEICGPA